MSVKISSASRHHPLHAQRRTLRIPFGAQRFLAAFEGIEGGFAIATSIVLALSFTELDRHLLILTALVSVAVNGFNGASIKYSSEHFLDELDGREKKSPFKAYFLPASIEFVSFSLISVLALAPILLISSLTLAVVFSVIITLIMLFVAGYLRGYMLHTSRLRDAWETTLLGGGIIVVGFIAGLLITIL